MGYIELNNHKSNLNQIKMKVQKFAVEETKIDPVVKARLSAKGYAKYLRTRKKEKITQQEFVAYAIEQTYGFR